MAEGVETLQQRDLLTVGGCDQLQGYFFSPPVPAEEFESLLARECLGVAAEKPEDEASGSSPAGGGSSALAALALPSTWMDC